MNMKTRGNIYYKTMKPFNGTKPCVKIEGENIDICSKTNALPKDTANITDLIE